MARVRRKDATRRVAEHCPVHETINTIDAVEFVLMGSEELEATV